MSYFDDDDDRGLSLPVVYTILAVAGIVLILILVVVSQNRGTKGSAGSKMATPSPVVEALTTETQSEEETQGLRSEDLDFWDMYGERTEQETERMPEETAIPTPTPSPSMEPSPTPTEDPAYQNVKKNTVDYMKLKTVNGQMAYYPDGFDHAKASRVGVELSQKNGQVDFDWLKRNGVEFVMLKVGGRGYETGVISEDESFREFLEAAQKAGLDVGVVFCSQAVSVTEAVEEANFVVQELQGNTIRYPVAFMMETITNDEARTDTLSVEQKSEIAEAFLQTVTYDGYQAILYGDSEWLLEEIRPEELLVHYDVLLDETASLPEYPYEFKMWKYETGASLAGVEFGCDYLISFVDYSKK